DVANSIASGDIRANSQDASMGTNAARVVLSNSNYATEIENPVDPGDIASVTDPGTGTNQITPPTLADPDNGDFHELASSSSPTAPAPSGPPLLGSPALDGNPRSPPAACGGTAVPDIGAYELTPDCSSAPPPPAPGATLRLT